LSLFYSLNQSIYCWRLGCRPNRQTHRSYSCIHW